MLKISLIFRSKKKSSVGGAEISMLRLMRYSLDKELVFNVILYGMMYDTYRELLQENNIQVFYAPDMFSLYKILRKIKPNICYLFTRVHLITWSIISRLAGVPIIVSAERGSADTIIDRISQLLGKHFVHAFITNSKSAEKQLIKALIPKNRIYTIYNGIDSEKLSCYPQKIEIIGCPKIICVANIFPGKGQYYLLEAAQKLKEFYPNINAVLVGKDYTGGKFFNEISNKNFPYTWIDGVKDVIPLLNIADIFVLPSLREGVPTSIIEAMISEVPVIASNINGVNELVIPYKTGLLFEARNSNDLTKKISEILQNSQLRNDVVKNAKLMVEGQFTVRAMYDNHYKAFSLLQTQHGRNF